MNMRAIPITNFLYLEKVFHPPLITLPQTISMRSPKHLHCPHVSLYFTDITHLQKYSLSTPYCHNHFSKRAWLKLLDLQILNPHSFNGEYTTTLTNHMQFRHIYHPPRKKSLRSFSTLLKYNIQYEWHKAWVFILWPYKLWTSYKTKKKLLELI